MREIILVVENTVCSTFFPNLRLSSDARQQIHVVNYFKFCNKKQKNIVVYNIKPAQLYSTNVNVAFQVYIPRFAHADLNWLNM